MTDLQTTTQSADLLRLMELAVTQGEGGVAALERLVALQERAQAIAAQAAHAAAVASFQEHAPSIKKNARGAHGATYATLDHILDTIRIPMAREGLAVTFDSEETDDGRLQVSCIVHHAMGHAERASFTVSREAKSNRMNDTQRDGSALSYARRYALSLALGITTGDGSDDDGGAAMRAAEPISEEQAATIQSLIDELGERVDVPAFMKWAGVERIDELPAQKYKKAVQALQSKRK